MRIVVNDIAASEGGALTILESLSNYIRSCDHVNEWIFLLGGDLIPEDTNIRVRVFPKVKGSWLHRLTFDFIVGRREIAALNPDVVLSLQNTLVSGVACPQVVYVHQPIPFQTTKKFSFVRRGERLLAVYQHIIGRVIKKSVSQASHVIVQTEWMRDAILD